MRYTLRSVGLGLGLAGALLAGPAAQAAPILYILDGIATDVTVTRDGVGIGGSSSSIPIVGQTFSFDEAVPAATSFAIEVTGDFSNRIVLSTPVDVGFGPVDEIIVSSAVLSSVASASYPATGGGGIYDFNGVSGGGAVAEAVADLLLSNGGGPQTAVNGFMTPASSISGTLFLDPGGAIELVVSGFTLFEFTTVTGELITAKADILVTGNAIPEPNAALLFCVAVLAVGARVRSLRRI